MGRIEWDGNKTTHLDALARYVEIQGGSRLIGYRAGAYLVIRPRVVSKTVDTVFVRNVTDAVWNAIREKVKDRDFEVLPAEGYSFSDDRGLVEG